MLEDLTSFRLKVLKENQDYRKIEDIIATGQLEELIETAKDELTLLPKLAEWKEWEVDEFTGTPIVYEPTPLSHVGNPIKT
jgi:NADH dehydrogenase (ubiquinone) 1 alpha subcomplex subunit 5